MRRLYEEYFHIPEDGKIREKVFVSRVIAIVVGILVCMSAMGFTAYAYFTSSITSGSNTITAATYSVEVEIVPNGGTAIEANTGNPLTYKVNAGTYKVALNATGTATTGYCKIEITGSEKTLTIFTQQIAPNTNMSFTLVLNGGADITVTPQWGTYANRDVVVGNGSTQEVQLVTEVEKDVTTPNAIKKTEPSTGETKIQGSTSTSGKGTENSDSLDASPNDSLDDQDGDGTTADGVNDETSNSEIDDGSSETVQDGNVIE